MTTLALWFTLFLLIALAILLWPLLKKKTENTPAQKKTVIGIALFVPVFSMGLYFTLGTPQFADIHPSQVKPEVVTLVDKLEQKLAKNPQDVTGWLLLGRSYMVEENYPKAVKAFEKAVQLDPKNLNALLPLADALAIQNSGNLSGKPYELLQTAFAVDAKNTMTLWLLGMAEKQQGNKQQATQYWLDLYDLLPEDHADRTTIMGLLSSVGYIPGMANLPQPTRASPNPTEPFKAEETPTQTNAAPEKLTKKSEDKPQKSTPNQAILNITIEASFLAKYPQATLFVYAKEPKGMPMPIAAKQIPLKNLPAGENQIVLTKADTIMPNRQLEQFANWTVGYRITDLASIDQGKIIQKQETTVQQGDITKFIIKN